MLFEHFSQQRLRLDVAGKSSWNCLFEIVFPDYGLTVFTKSSNKTCRKDYIYIYSGLLLKVSHILSAASDPKIDIFMVSAWLKQIFVDGNIWWHGKSKQRRLSDTWLLSPTSVGVEMKSKKLRVRRTQERYTVCSHSEPAYTAPLDPAHTVNVISHMGAVPALSG